MEARGFFTTNHPPLVSGVFVYLDVLDVKF